MKPLAYILFFWLPFLYSIWMVKKIANYEYNKFVRPKVNPWLYSLQAHWELWCIKVKRRAKEIEESEQVDTVEVEEVKPVEVTRFEWEVDNTKRLGQNITTTTIIIDND